MSADWIVAPRAPHAFVEALRDLHPLTAQTLFARGFADPDEARAFLLGEVRRVDPFALRDMRPAVERVLTAIRRGESIAVYGDYDCDGVTSSALMMRTLRALGANAQVYIPNRFEEGYGLHRDALDTLRARGVSVVITVDCGARAMNEAQHAKDVGLDLIITDHHELEEGKIPSALAVINPQRPDCDYGYKKLAGVGVAFRLAQAVLREARGAGMPRDGLSEAALLDLVAIGTVADVVELRGENRRLVREGLKLINTSPRPGIKALLNAARVRAGTVDAGRVGFALGPRLNAAGRLESALHAFELLDCEDDARAMDLAAKLDAQNRERQSVTATTARDAEQRAMSGTASGDKLPALLFAASEQYNPGVIGLVAARLMEKHYRPSVVVSLNDGGNGEARGSCRSFNGFHITQALDACRELLYKHGGHAAAAGFTLPSERIDVLRQRLNDVAERAQPSGGWKRTVRADAELRLDQLDWKALTELQMLEPHGMGNAKPTFVARGARVSNAYRMGRAEGSAQPPHLKIALSDDRPAKWDVVGWRMGDRACELREGACIDIAFRLDVNEWNGEKRMQLEIVDFRAAGQA